MYRVTWEIDIEADSPRRAAEMAFEIQQSHGHIATVFKVAKWSGRRFSKNHPMVTFTQPVEIDLSKEG